MNDQITDFKNSEFCKEFINCVKENYNLILKLNFELNKDLSNESFSLLVKKISETFKKLNLFEQKFPEYFPEYDYFNDKIVKSKDLSKAAIELLNNQITIEEFIKVVDNYGDDDGLWLANYSLILK